MHAHPGTSPAVLQHEVCLSGAQGVDVIYMEWGFGDECINGQKAAFLKYSFQLTADK